MVRPMVMWCLAWLAIASEAEAHARGLIQLTGKRQRVGQTRYRLRSPADPFIDLMPNGQVRVLGTTPYGQNHYYLQYESLEHLLRGARPTTRKLELAKPLRAKEHAWDWNVHRFADGSEVMYAGVMTPTGRRQIPKWPDDNWTRRIYAFTKNAAGQWVMRDRPLFGAVTRETQATMIGHAYGHHFKQVGDETWLFHEEVSGAGPFRTEIFARRMLDPFTASDEKVKILGVGDPPAFGRRQSGDYLIEGPRPFTVDIDGEEVHMVSFSSADYANDSYDIHFAWRKGDPIGPYQPITKNGSLVGFAERLKQKHRLSWLGRADMVKDARGRWWAVFHAVDKRILPDRDYSGRGQVKLSDFQRNLYAVPVEFRRGPSGEPVIELED